MTYLRSMRWLVISSLLASSLSACSSLEDVLYPENKDNTHGLAPNNERRQEKVISSRLEWAIQNYEAGAYEQAISQFLSLQKEGANVPSYEMIPFYLGMSYFKLGKYKEARPQLEAFLRQQNRDNAEARISLLLVYEQMRDWNQVVALAAETDKHQLFQDNRTLLKLIWARALREKGEILGARSALENASTLLANTPESPFALQDASQDLWGRYHFVHMLSRESECAAYTPKSQKKKKLYSTWLEAEGDCLVAALEESNEVFRKESPWSPKVGDILNRSLQQWGEKIRTYYKAESKSLPSLRTYEKLVRQQLYRVMNTVEEQIKIFKNQNVKTKHLEQIRKQLDLLLVSFSSPN